VPLPVPRKNEKQSHFVSRCIEFETKASPGRKPEQIQAMCYTAWRDRFKESTIMLSQKKQKTLCASPGSFEETKAGFRKDCIGNKQMDEQMTLEFAKMFEGASFERDDARRKFIIKNVALLGAVSLHGYEYLPEAMQKAVPLYNNIKAFVNHPSADELKVSRRDVRNIAGKFINPRFESSPAKVRGDFVGLPNENGKLFMDVAQNMPDIAAMSHNARGKFAQRDGKKVVEEIQSVYSVDLVASGATNTTMFESDNSNNVVKENTMEWKDVDSKGLKDNRHDLFEEIFSAGATSRDEEVKELSEDLDKTKQELDKLEVEKTMGEKEALVNKLLTESKLPAEAKTDIFRQQLTALQPEKEGNTIEEQVKKLIDDRIVAISGKKGVTNMGGEKNLSESNKNGKPTLRKVS